MADDKPIIVIKKKGGHGGHHGGAWKVAYADFVTAMMAFFMVMWLLNSASEPVKQNVASYFRKPGIFSEGSGTPLGIGSSGILEDAPPPLPEEKKKGSGMDNQTLQKKSGSENERNARKTSPHRGFESSPSGEKRSMGEIDESEQGPQAPSSEQVEQMEAIAQEIKQQIVTSSELKDIIGSVDIKLDADGLSIELMDTAKTSMFASGAARILPEAERAYAKMAEILGKVPNALDVVGHTDSSPFSKRADGYSNWELSGDRANAARRMLIRHGISAERFTSVIGRADRELKTPDEPGGPSNRRITLKLRFNQPPPPDNRPKEALNYLNRYQKRYTQGQVQKVEDYYKKKQQIEEQKNRALNQKNAPSKDGRVTIPEDPKTPDFIPKDLIFGDQPIIAPTGRF